MTKKDLKRVQRILEKITNPDDEVRLALATVKKNIEVYEACRGQLKNNYDYPSY